jgi:uncharacterized protein YaiL (DUF2058 family)
MSKQKLSLQEQLLKSGLASVAQAKSVKTEKRKQNQQQRHSSVVTVVDEAKELALKVRAEQVEKDKTLNLLRNQQEAQKALHDQIKQLIENNRKPQDFDGLAYKFNDNNKVKTVYVSESMRDEIIKGHLAIVKLGEPYEIVTVEVAKKISERDKACVIVLNESPSSVGDEAVDPYAAYAVPDDLVW